MTVKVPSSSDGTRQVDGRFGKDMYGATFSNLSDGTCIVSVEGCSPPERLDG